MEKLTAMNLYKTGTGSELGVGYIIDESGKLSKPKIFKKNKESNKFEPSEEINSFMYINENLIITKEDQPKITYAETTIIKEDDNVKEIQTFLQEEEINKARRTQEGSKKSM